MPESSDSESNRRTIFQATITADRDVFASLDDLDIDYMPTRERLRNGRWKATAVVELKQLRAIVAAGAVVELQRVIDPRFPKNRILSSDAARRRLTELEQHFRTEG